MIKKFSLVFMICIMILTSAFTGCANNKKLTEKEFNVLWQEYIRREFEESFDEKQSVSQKEKILSQLLSEYGITSDDFKSYMKNNHIDKYKKIFIE